LGRESDFSGKSFFPARAYVSRIPSSGDTPQRFDAGWCRDVAEKD